MTPFDCQSVPMKPLHVNDFFENNLSAVQKTEQKTDKGKKTKQLTFRTETDLVQELEDLAMEEGEEKLATFIRKLLRVSTQLYRKHGSLQALRLAASTSEMLEPSSHSPNKTVPLELTSPAKFDTRSAGKSLLKQLTEVDKGVQRAPSGSPVKQRIRKNKPTGTS
jgi:hypothetical protein